MQCRNHLRAFPDRCRDALDRTGAHIANGEDAAPAGLQGMAITARIAAGKHKALGIERDAGTRKPIGIRIGANKQEQVADRPPHVLSIVAPPPADRLQHAVAAFEAS